MQQLELFGDGSSSQPEVIQSRKEKIESIAEILKNRPAPDPRSPIVVSYGGGVDSTALLIAMYLKGIRPDLIVFSDTGDEKDETYAFIKLFNRWLKSIDFPSISRTRYRMQIPKERKKLLTFYSQKYWKTIALASLEAWTVAYQNVRQSVRYSTLMEKCIVLKSLPSKAFGRGGCSLTWKIQPNRLLVSKWMAKSSISFDVPVRSVVGINAGEQSRLLNKKGELKPLKETVFGVTFITEYPLIEWGLDKDNERALITSIGLSIPPKSSCKRCPHMTPPEILALSDKDYEIGCFIEENAEPFTSIKGLGRSFSWRELKRLSPMEQLLLTAQQESRQCSCID